MKAIIHRSHGEPSEVLGYEEVAIPVQFEDAMAALAAAQATPRKGATILTSGA
jgi:hypothetical protein